MPELPEVETIRRQLEPALVGRKLSEVEVLDELWSRPATPAQIAKRTEGRRIESVARRGKYLIVGLEGGVSLVMHLRMTGNLLLRGEDSEPGERGGREVGDARRLGPERLYESDPDARFLRVAMTLDDGTEVWFTDARRFGTGIVLADDELGLYLDSRLGIEPLDGELSPDHLLIQASGRTAPLKSFLLDQRRIAGIGNIYADEALHRAELHPLSPAGSMRYEHAEALAEGIVDALEAGLANGGSSIDDYRDARGERGSMQEEFLVHTRAGQPCPRCNTTIERIVVGGRATYFCPNCQVKLRRRPKRRARK